MNTSSNSSTFNVTLPLFSFLTINTWLLATWTFAPNPRYLCNLNLFKLRDAPAHTWNLPAGVRTRESIVAAREEFIKTLYTATSMQSTTAAAETFSKNKEDQSLDKGASDLRQNVPRDKL